MAVTDMWDMSNQTTAEQAAKNRKEDIDDTKRTDGQSTQGSDARATPSCA